MIWVYEPKNLNPTAGWVGWSPAILRSTLLPRVREGKEEMPLLRCKLRGLSISSMVPLFVPNLSPLIGSPLQMEGSKSRLPLCGVVQDPHGTDPTQETRTKSCGVYRSQSATRARSYKIGNRSSICDLDHQPWESMIGPRRETFQQLSTEALIYFDGSKGASISAGFTSSVEVV